MMNWIWLGAVVAFGVLEAATAALVSIWFCLLYTSDAPTTAYV